MVTTRKYQVSEMGMLHSGQSVRGTGLDCNYTTKFCSFQQNSAPTGATLSYSSVEATGNLRVPVSEVMNVPGLMINAFTVSTTVTASVFW